MAQQLNIIKHNFDENSPNANRLRSKLILLESRIKERVETTKTTIMLEDFFEENALKRTRTDDFSSTAKRRIRR